MKTIKILFTLTMLSIATSTSAQFANTGSTGGIFSSGTMQTDDYSRIKISFTKASPSSKDGSAWSFIEDSFNGISVEYLYGMNITPNYPLFLEYGANLSWVTSTSDIPSYEILYFDDGKYSSYGAFVASQEEYKFNILTATIPVNVAYKFSINDDITIEPHVGLGIRFNILAKASDGEDSYDLFDDSYYEKQYDDYTWNRFQLCGQAGLGVSFQKYYIGWEYSMSFMEIAKDFKFSTNYFSIGYNF